MKDGDFINKNFLLKNLIEIKENTFNAQYGGFEKAPKSPNFFTLYSLMKISYIKDSQILQKMIEKTLISIYKGGIFDHIGYGFFNYTIDDKWLVPSFKKTLFDNASALLAYSIAFKVTKNSTYKNIAYEVISYLNRTLLSPLEGYYISENNCFKNCDLYSFSHEEVLSILEEDTPLFSIYYDITKEGNFNNRNILNLIDRDLELTEFFDDKNHIIIKKLLNYREHKYSLNIDKKISLSDNGLIIGALCYSGHSFNDKSLITMAKYDIDFILNRFYDGTELYENYMCSHNFSKAALKDYTLFIFGLIEYYKVSKKDYYMELAVSLTNYTIENFYDKEKLLFTPANLINYRIDLEKTSTPNIINKVDINSIMILNLINLSKIKPAQLYQVIINQTLENLYPKLLESPADYCSMIFNLLYWNNINTK